MKREEFLRHIRTILVEEGQQTKKGRAIKSRMIKQRRAINAIAKELGFEKITLDDIGEISFG